MPLTPIDIELIGSSMVGFWALYGRTAEGREFINSRLETESWQGSAHDGISIDSTRTAEEVTYLAVNDGLTVCVNGHIVECAA